MRKIFTFLCAALMSVGMYATTVVTITNSDFPSHGQSFTKDGVTVSAGMIDGDEGNLMAGGSFSTTLGNFTQIEVNAMDVNISGEGWSGNSQKKTWTGNASSVSFSGEIMGMGMGTTLKFTIEEPAPTTYTLQLVADPEKGSVAVTNLLGSDIVDNGNGNYTVPENAEVTILATPLEGYEFTGWKVGNIEEMVGCYYCGTALNTEDNPLTFTMTADVAYLAEFEAAAPQPDPTVMFIAFPTENRPENIELAGVNREFTWEMVALDNDPWYVSKEHLNTYATDTIKFRDAANNAMILCEFIPANGDQEGRWQQLYLVMGDYPMDSYKLDIVRYIDELDLSNASNYAWMENAPEPLPLGIEHIVLTEKAKKVVVDGMIYIVRDGKLFNLTGAQVK